MDNIVNVYVAGLPMCRQPAWDAETILAAREHGVSLCCSHTPEMGEKLASFLRARGFDAYVRSGNDSWRLCEPMPFWDEDGNEEWPEFDYDARWWGE